MNRALRVGRMPPIAVRVLARSGDDGHPIKLGLPEQDDVYIVQAKRAEELMSAQGFSEIVVATTGEMARNDGDG